MSEWSNEHDWKSCDVKASAGSNPVLCAKLKNRLIWSFAMICKLRFKSVFSFPLPKQVLVGTPLKN